MGNVSRDQPLKSYRDLTVWQKSVDLVESIYRLSASFPDSEKYGLTSQLRRAVVSVPSNIAEGYGRDHRGDYRHHLSIANGSLKEVETQLIIAGRLEYMDKEQARPIWELAQDVGMMLNRLRASLKPPSAGLKPGPQNPEPGTRNCSA